MDIALVNKGKDTIEVEFRDTAAYVLLEPLRVRLLADETVDMASVDADHPSTARSTFSCASRAASPRTPSSARCATSARATARC